MNNRERFFRLLNNEPVDRVPIWLLFPYHTTGFYADVRSLPLYQPVFKAAMEHTVMLDRRGFGLPLFTPDVAIWQEHFVDGDWQVERKYFSYGNMELYSEKRVSPDTIKIKRLIDTDEDLLTILQYPILVDEKEICGYLEKKLPHYMHEMNEFPLESGAMMLDLGEPISFLYHHANLESYALWSMVYSDEICRFLDRILEQKKVVYEYTLKKKLADVYFLVGSELASPPLVSRETFQKWVVPYAQELIALIHRYGKKAIQHYHGAIKTILPDFLTMGPDALHTIEAPPVGNCALTEAFSMVGDAIVLIGNIQYDCFRSYTSEQMRAAVQEILTECRGNRLILSPTAGPYEAEVGDRFIQNYLAFINAALEYGNTN